MATRHREEFTTPVQLESLLEVPVKLILIEDLIREKSGLGPPGSDSQDTDDGERNDYRRADAGTSCAKKCLFDCCATPSRWRDTKCFSNNSQFRTASIALPWHDSVAVIPVMQIENPTVGVSAHVDIIANEDTDTDVEVSNKTSDDDDEMEKRSTPDAVPLRLTKTPSRNQIISRNNSNEDDEINKLSKQSNNESPISQDGNAPAPVENSQQTEPSTLPTSPSTAPPLSALLGKVIEKPTQYEDFIIAHCSNSSSSNNSCNTITQGKEQHQQDAIRDATGIVGQGSNNSADDTLKLTFYNEGRKESTKEFRPASIDSGGISSAANDVRYFENQHGLQMSRVVREPGSELGSEGNARMRQKQSIPLESTATIVESRSKDNVSNDDNTHNSSRNLNNNNISDTSSNNTNGKNLSATSSIITQPQQLRLTSSIIQNVSSSDNNTNSSNNSVSTDNSGNISNNDNTSTQQHGRQWEGLHISRCQKDGNNVMTVDGESSREITSESSLTTTITRGNPTENEKGESENSIDRHLQTYLTSLRYVKSVESGSESNAVGQEAETCQKGRSPVISPQSRHAPTSIISPVISPHISSPGSRSGPSSVANVVRMPNIQRVSPSQQAASLESWPERTIARIPTRPFLRRNSNYELPQQQQPNQPTFNRPLYHSNVQKQSQRTPPTTMAAAPTSTTPLQSPPKRFKSATIATVTAASPMMSQSQYQSHAPQQIHQQQQYQQVYNASANKYPSVSNTVAAMSHNLSRTSTNVNVPHHTMQQHVPTITNSNNVRIPGLPQQAQHHPIQAYNNLSHYNQRQPSQQHITPATAAATMNTTQRPHYSPGTAQAYVQQQHQSQQQYQYQMKYHGNSSSQSQQQQQLHQFQRHLQESLLIASTAMASSSEPIDSSYNERLRRYCEFYQRQELDVTKLQEYYKKYGFYPWDILTARDESIIRQMRNQEQQQHHQPEYYQLGYSRQSDAREDHTPSTARYDAARRMEMEHHLRQLPTRAMNVVNSPSRVVPTFSPSSQPPVAQALVVSGGAHHGGLAAGRAISVTPPIVSPQASTMQNRYAHNTQQVQQLSQNREYAAHQQRLNSRYYQSEYQQENQNYNNNPYPEHHQQQQPRPVEVRTNTNYDIQNFPHYRNAYNQLAVAAAAVSTVAAGTATAAVSQNQLRSADVRLSNIAQPVRHLAHAQCNVGGSRPVVMTVSDPVPAPLDAVPLSIHRQALEQVFKNNHATGSNSVSDTHGGTGLNRDLGYRRDQRGSPAPHHLNHQMQQPIRHGQVYTQGRVRNEDIGATGGMGASVQNKEPLRVVSSPMLAHQTSVIRRIQQQESPASSATAPAVTRSSPNRYVSDRPGISYRRLSSGSNTDSGGGGGGQQTALSYQQHKDATTAANNYAHGQYQQQQQYYHQSYASSGAASGSNANRNIFRNENGQGIQRGTLKRRIIITDNNGTNKHLTETDSGVVSSPIPLIAGAEEVITTSGTPTAVVRNAVNEELPEDEYRGDSIGDASWQYDHVVLLDKRIRTYMCKRCFETLKTEQQIRNHLFCKMLANHVQCHVCLQLITADTYPAHLQIHGVRPPDT